MRLTLPRRRPGPVTRPAGGHGFKPLPRMVPVMRRIIATFGVLGLLGAGLGCQHIGGKCDCGAHPADAVIGPPTPPYPIAPVGGVVPVQPIPPSVPNGKGMELPPDAPPPLAKPDRN